MEYFEIDRVQDHLKNKLLGVSVGYFLDTVKSGMTHSKYERGHCID